MTDDKSISRSDARAEIERQSKSFRQQRDEIIAIRASIAKDVLRGGTGRRDEDEQVARQIAARMLNGSAPATLSAPAASTSPADVDRDLAHRQRAIDIILKVLSDKSFRIAAELALEWQDANRELWRAHCAETILCMTRLAALENRTIDFFASCPDIETVTLPLTEYFGQFRTTFEPRYLELAQKAALAEGAVSAADLKKAAKC